MHFRDFKTAQDISKILNTTEMINPVLVLGNGFNIELGVFRDGWKGLLEKIAKELFDDKYSSIKDEFTLIVNSEDVTLPEVYDWLLIRYQEQSGKQSTKRKINPIVQKLIEKESKSLLESAPLEKGKISNVINWCKQKEAPILTTNYDKNLLLASTEFILQSSNNAKKSHSYPFNCCFSPNDMGETGDVLKQFAIWHINGFLSYRDSIRLNARDYVSLGSRVLTQVEKLKRELVDDRTWISIFIRGDLIFAGIGLGPQETVIRSLLIERKRYYLNHGQSVPKAYYIRYNKTTIDDVDIGQQLFLESLGLEFLDLKPGEKLSDVFKN